VLVVSNTTPLNYLLLADAIDVLPKLFLKVLVPKAVLTELLHAKAPEAVRLWAQSAPTWIAVHDPAVRLASTVRLDDGEADAISLAKEHHITEILKDERRGRTVARQEGLNPIRTLAILERAAERCFLELRPAVERLQRTTIRIPKQHIDAALARDDARKAADRTGPPLYEQS